MKDVLVISTHSFVDLITNSSSELFVCDTKKTLDGVKELLAKLLKMHDEVQGVSHNFDDVFGKITISKYGFDWYALPQPIKKNYEYFHERHFNHSQFEIVCGSERSPEEGDLENKAHQIGKELNVWEKDLAEKDKKEHNRRWALWRKKEDELWTDWGARKLRSELDLFLEFFKQNNLPDDQIKIASRAYDKMVAKHIADKAGKYAGAHWVRHFDNYPDLKEAHETIEHWESWGITAKKGSIFVQSESDNTIPYELMETISSYLSAARYHLG